MKQPSADSCRTGHWHTRGPGAAINTQCQALSTNAKLGKRRHHAMARSGYSGRAAQHQPLAYSSSPGQASAIADIGEAYQFTACHMYAAWYSQQPTGGDGNQSGRGGKECLQHAERPAFVLGANGLQRPPPGAASPEIVDAGPEQLPFTGLALLVERIDVQLMASRQSPDEREQRGDHPFSTRAVNASRNDECNLHSIALASTAPWLRF